MIPGRSLPQGAATRLPRLRSPHCSPEMRAPGTDRRKRSVFVRAPRRRKRHRACSLCALAPSRLRAKRNAPSQFAKCPTSLVAGDGFASALWNRTWRSGRQSTELFDSQSAESGPANAHTLRTKPAGRRLRPDLPLHCGIERAAADGSPWRCSIPNQLNPAPANAKRACRTGRPFEWLRGPDLNRRPSGYELAKALRFPGEPTSRTTRKPLGIT